MFYHPGGDCDCPWETLYFWILTFWMTAGWILDSTRWSTSSPSSKDLITATAKLSLGLGVAQRVATCFKGWNIISLAFWFSFYSSRVYCKSYSWVSTCNLALFSASKAVRKTHPMVHAALCLYISRRAFYFGHLLEECPHRKRLSHWVPHSSAGHSWIPTLGGAKDSILAWILKIIPNVTKELSSQKVRFRFEQAKEQLCNSLQIHTSSPL